jgi:integrase
VLKVLAEVAVDRVVDRVSSLSYRLAMATVASGHIERLPSGSLRVRVYGGKDPVTGKERRYKRTVRTEAQAAAELARLLRDVEAARAPDDSATVALLLDRYLDVADLEVSTREAHEGYVRRTIKPVLGGIRVRKLRADTLDALYAHLKKCSRLCGRLPKVEHHTAEEHMCDARCGPLRDHRTSRPHQCDERCRPHRCKPMAPGSILRIHAIISAALNLAVRSEWIDRNPAEKATPPRARKREPDPPSPAQAARLLNEVWQDDEQFGLYLWAAFTTGARRGELLALRESRFDFEAQEVTFARNYLVKQGQRIEKDTKTGEGRRLSLDPLTCELFAEHFRRRRAAVGAAGVTVPPDAFAFSPDPAGSHPWNPDTMTHRYGRYAVRVGISSSLKELRHYSATQLLSNGVDLRTVAGRLGHAEGSTTLRFYAQFAQPADQAAANLLSGQLAGLRKKELLRELFSRQSVSADGAGLGELAAELARVVGLDDVTALALLTEFAAERPSSTP